MKLRSRLLRRNKVKPVALPVSKSQIKRINVQQTAAMPEQSESRPQARRDEVDVGKDVMDGVELAVGIVAAASILSDLVSSSAPDVSGGGGGFDGGGASGDWD